ncbi:hypothetical protein [Streptomyces sp. WZ.A104]|uniref:hypothetical protein n=1 Tax=Streptomyces sp. WZ.A104 TaxID=2023771 RepID=UPI0015CA9045|nr:hypothetical protein [Streptomyces sp. WZ.A104]
MDPAQRRWGGEPEPEPPTPHWEQGARPGGPAPPAAAPPSRRKHRVFFWCFLAVQILFIVWIVTGIAAVSGTPAECQGLTGNDLQLCKDARDVGAAIGVGFIVGLWVAVDFILALTYSIHRLTRR